MSNLIAPLIVIPFFLFLFSMELFFPLRKPERPLMHRLFVNAVMSILTFGTAALVVRPISLATMKWGSSASVGLLHLINVATVPRFILGFLLLDVTFYYWHRLNHRLPFLWRFHNVHHSDPDLDASTGFRFHFGEVFLSTGFRVVQIVAVGPSLQLFLLYELVFQAGTYFHHSNMKIPFRLEAILNLLLVTPRMHGIHHSQFHNETDSNYSVVISLWDRLHRTYRWSVPQDEITIGVPGYHKTRDNMMSNLIRMPFMDQKDYWQGNETRPRDAFGTTSTPIS